MIDDGRVAATPVLSISLFPRIWSVASLAAAATVNLAWIGLLGYRLFKLVYSALS